MIFSLGSGWLLGPMTGDQVKYHFTKDRNRKDEMILNFIGILALTALIVCELCAIMKYCIAIDDRFVIKLLPSVHPFQTKIAADDILIFYFYLSKKIRLDFSCEPSA